ncbi:MAG: hypothetical protein WC679_13740 [Bacteroidales bacterium]|jgi:hypothetical protein
MKTIINEVTFKMDGLEAYSIACSLKKALKTSIDNHYCKFEDKTFFDLETNEMRLIADFFKGAAYEETYEEVKQEMLEYLHKAQEKLKVKN